MKRSFTSLLCVTAAACGGTHPGVGAISAASDAASADSQADEIALHDEPLVDVRVEIDGPGEEPVDCSAFVDAGATLPDGDPIGWASVDDGDGGTAATGGRGGQVVLARTADELLALGADPNPLIIQVCGHIGTGTERIKIMSNKTVVGVGTKPTIHASIDVKDSENVIIRNLFIEGGVPDGIGVRRSHHLWFDHLDISDSADGNLDITDQSNYVTVSFSKFWYRDPAQPHRFSNLIGSDDTIVADEGLLKVTWHHNWWADNVFERMPRTRHGDIHVFDNYYTSTGNSYCVQAGYLARVLVENNYFKSVANPMILSAGGNLLERGSIFDGTVGMKSTTGVAFDPPYHYELEAAGDVPATVMREAGPR
jgi:pectate lyase